MKFKTQPRFKIVGLDGRAVSHLHRARHGVAIYYPGSIFAPPRRGRTPAHTIVMQGEASYPAGIARGWLTSLRKAGHDDFRAVPEDT